MPASFPPFPTFGALAPLNCRLKYLAKTKGVIDIYQAFKANKCLWRLLSLSVFLLDAWVLIFINQMLMYDFPRIHERSKERRKFYK